jgi:hypothetical protein
MLRWCLLTLLPLTCHCVCEYVSSMNATSSVQLEVTGAHVTHNCAHTVRTYVGKQNGFHPMLAVDARVQGVHRFVDCSVLMRWRVPNTLYIDVDRWGQTCGVGSYVEVVCARHALSTIGTHTACSTRKAAPTLCVINPRAYFTCAVGARSSTASCTPNA